MSKTDKTKPVKVQIREAGEKINWHTDVKWKREHFDEYLLPKRFKIYKEDWKKGLTYR